MNLWGGRFKESPAEALKRFNDSFAFDVRLLEEDVRGSIAWAEALQRCGVLTASEAQQITTALSDILSEGNGDQASARPGRLADPTAVSPVRSDGSSRTDGDALPGDAARRPYETGVHATPQVLPGAADVYSATTETSGDDARSGFPPSRPMSERWNVTHEDIHSYVEQMLREKVGPLAGKLHTGRSRNDQVATDLKLYLRGAFEEAREGALMIAEVLTGIAEREADTTMPGYTHLQQAELITFGHWSLAWVEMLLRDVDRIDTAARRADECPLGSGALAGTPLNIDRHALAVSLGFSRPAANSLDAVSDRDAAVDYLYCVTMLFNHLSRLAEDLILFSTREYSFVELPDAYATGSSRMPQKKNPDVLELVRGHGGRMIGELSGLLALLKGLPLAYNKDLQLDKEPLFRARDLVAAAVPALTGLLAGLTVNREALQRASSDDALLATQLADAMTRRGVPFRKAHEIVGERLLEAEARETTLRDLGPSEEITARDLEAVNVDLAVARKSAFGGTSPARVRVAVAAARERIASATQVQEELVR